MLIFSVIDCFFSLVGVIRRLKVLATDQLKLSIFDTKGRESQITDLDSTTSVYRSMGDFIVFRCTWNRPLRIQLLYLLSMRPSGVVSKKDIGDLRLLASSPLCNCLDAWIAPKATATDRLTVPRTESHKAMNIKSLSKCEIY